MYQKMEIHAGLEEMKSVPNALLVDVRNPSEYDGGHIPGSINFAMSRILKDLLGYESVVDLGGIASYNGPRE